MNPWRISHIYKQVAKLEMASNATSTTDLIKSNGKNSLDHNDETGEISENKLIEPTWPNEDILQGNSIQRGVIDLQSKQ